MTTVTGITAARGAAIEAASVVDGEVVGDDLILTKFDGSTINAGNVRGADGPTGPTGVSIPSGGTTGQALVKLSATNYDVAWSTFLNAASLGFQTATYTLAIGDANNIVMMYSATATNVVVPLSTGGSGVAFPIGTKITIIQTGTGDVNITYVGGVTVSAVAPYVLTLLGQGAVVNLIKVSTDSWVATGDLETSELGWQTFIPTVTCKYGSTPPNLGSAPVEEGYYMVDLKGRVTGGGTVRWGGTGQTQGNGYYQMRLPEFGVNYDPVGFTPIGVVNAGTDAFTHVTGVLHLDGNEPDLKKGIGAMTGGLFLSHSFPDRSGGTIKVQNVHYAFHYQLDA
jgi:hypothetical protein